MIESLLGQLIISTLQAGLSARSISATIKRGQQPTQQGAVSGAAYYLWHIDTVPVGWPEVQDVWNASTSIIDHTESQRQESRYQFSILAPVDLTNANAMLAIDYARIAATIFQSRATIDVLSSQGVGVQFITQIRQSYFSDDFNRYEGNPTFDVKFSHADSITIPGNKIDKFTNNFNSVST